jgi:hypothetical protein
LLALDLRRVTELNAHVFGVGRSAFLSFHIGVALARKSSFSPMWPENQTSSDT